MLLKPKTILDCFRRWSSTIFALSSGHGKCGVAVIRISGPAASKAVVSMTVSQCLPTPRRAMLQTLIHPVTKEILDHAITLWFPEPKSFTGESCVELHVHGGVAVVNAVLSALSCLGDDFRPAEPGEFTKRAFFAGKLDLTQVEGLGDLIHAETEMQRKQALRQMDGELCGLYSGWREKLVRLLANIEAYIDFSESDEIEDGVPQLVENGVRNLLRELNRHLSDARAGERLRSGVHVAIVGEPNVGKSTLLNLLVRRPAAIVSPIAGTTRDLVETKLDIGGYPVVMVDTAGLREDASDEVEVEGMRRAVRSAESADLVIFVLDASSLTMDELSQESVLDKVVEARLVGFGIAKTVRKLVLVNKVDLLAENLVPRNTSMFSFAAVNFLSCKTNLGMEETLNCIKKEIATLCSTSLGESPSLSRSRHIMHVQRACESLESYLQDDSEDVGICSQHLRKAIREIGFLSGKVSSEHILDVIFADFCIGK